jgi:hypothetical protein
VYRTEEGNMFRDVAFVLLGLIVFTCLGLPVVLLIPDQVKARFLAAPGLGFGIFGIASTVLYKFGMPPQSTALAAVFVACAFGVLFSVIYRADLGRLAIPTGIAVAMTFVVLAPSWIGGAQFAAFQGNPWDQINYIAMTSAYGRHSFAELVSPSPEVAIENDYNLFAGQDLHKRPTVCVVLAAFREPFFSTANEAAYPYLGLLIMLGGFSFAFFLAGVVRAGWALTTFLTIAFATGTYSQVILDINAWGHLSAVPLALLTVGITMLLVEQAPQVSRFALAQTAGALTISAASVLYFYPEIAPTCAAAAATIATMAVLLNDQRNWFRIIAILTVAAGAALIMCIPFWRGTVGMLLLQVDSAQHVPNDWFYISTGYLFGRDAPFVLEKTSDLTTRAYEIFSLPAQIGVGALGVPFIMPPVGTPRFLATTWSFGVYFFAAIAFAAMALAAVRFWRDRDVSRLYVLSAACGALLIALGLLASWKLWAAGKALLMAAPFLFTALTLPLLRSDLSTMWRAVPALIVGLHLWFGVDRLPASAGDNGIHRPAPYPIWRSFKTSHNWDIGRFKEALQQCRHAALGIAQPHMSRYVQIFLSDLNVPWHSLRSLNSYYGQGKGIDLGVQSATKPADCLLVDNVDDLIPTNRVFWLGSGLPTQARLSF